MSFPKFLLGLGLLILIPIILVLVIVIGIPLMILQSILGRKIFSFNTFGKLFNATSPSAGSRVDGYGAPEVPPSQDVIDITDTTVTVETKDLN